MSISLFYKNLLASFLLPHPNLMAMLTCGTDRRISSSTDFTKFQRGCSTAQIIDIGIVGETDETILIDNLQGSGDALLPGIDFLANHLHAAHVSLQITVGSQF